MLGFGEAPVVGLRAFFLVFCSLEATASAHDLMGENIDGFLIPRSDTSFDGLESILDDALCDDGEINEEDGGGREEFGDDDAVFDGDNDNADADA